MGEKFKYKKVRFCFYLVISLLFVNCISALFFYNQAQHNNITAKVLLDKNKLLTEDVVQKVRLSESKQSEIINKIAKLVFNSTSIVSAFKNLLYLTSLIIVVLICGILNELRYVCSDGSSEESPPLQTD